MAVLKKNQVTLKPVEIKIIKLVCKDLSNAEIAEQAGKSIGGVEKIRKRIYKKTNSKSALSLFIWAVKNNYVKFKI